MSNSLAAHPRPRRAPGDPRAHHCRRLVGRAHPRAAAHACAVATAAGDPSAPPHTWRPHAPPPRRRRQGAAPGGASPVGADGTARRQWGRPPRRPVARMGKECCFDDAPGEATPRSGAHKGWQRRTRAEARDLRCTPEPGRPPCAYTSRGSPGGKTAGYMRRRPTRNKRSLIRRADRWLGATGWR